MRSDQPEQGWEHLTEEAARQDGRKLVEGDLINPTTNFAVVCSGPRGSYFIVKPDGRYLRTPRRRAVFFRTADKAMERADSEAGRPMHDPTFNLNRPDAAQAFHRNKERGNA